jgi:tetratricopeptide (TPR) repeat protein
VDQIGLGIQEKSKMRNHNYILIVVGMLFLAVVSCSKKISPAGVGEAAENKYNGAAFNYVYVEAIKQKLLGNGGDALKYLEQAIKINPRSDAAYYQMAQIVSANGNIAEGKRFVKKALSIDKENIWYLMMIAGFYYQERNIDSAIFYYETAVKYFPDEMDLQLTLGNLYSENKNYDKALSIFNSFDRKYGINENSTVSSIRTLIISQKWNEALEKVQILIKEFPDEVLYNGLMAEIYRGMGETQKAREVYDNLLERNPDDPQVQLAICDFLINEKDYTELFFLLNNVILNNNIKRENKVALFARLMELPDFNGKNYDELMMALMVFEANYKNDDIIPLLRPELLIKVSKLSDAAMRLEEIIKINPDNYYAWEKLLLVYNQMKDYKNLMLWGEECATRFNRSFLAKILYANGALESKNYDIALDELRKAEILAGDNKEFLTQVLTMRADVYYRMKNYDKAFETFEIALKSNSEDLTVINNYAYYLAEQNKNLREAEEMARKVIETEKENTTYLDTYAWVLYKRGKLKEASKIMKEIIDSGEKPDAEWYEHYGFILKRQHNCTEAIENWNLALKFDSTKTDLIEEIKSCRK